MKHFCTLIFLSFSSLLSFAQTNIFQENGNVGIGITNPTSKLDVLGQINSYYVGLGQNDYNTSSKNYVNLGANNHGSLILSSNLYVNGNDDLRVANTHATMSGASILMPGNSRPNQGGIVFFTNQPSPAIADSNFSGIAAMLIRGDGNVGISSPSDKLSVNGKIRAHEIKVETANWPDYVFAKEYQLPTLQETEEYIRTEGHLPGIPSAAEVKANGINLGEMNAKLLQKIEELTLIIIDLNKRTEEQSRDLKGQKQLLDHLLNRK